MKNLWLWIVAGVAILLIWKRKPAADPIAGKALTTATATAPQPYWTGWGKTSDTILNNTSSNIAAYTNASKSLASGVSSLFGGFSRNATGPAASTTSGSGAGVPVDTSLPDLGAPDYNPGQVSLADNSLPDLGSPDYNPGQDATDPNASLWGYSSAV